MISSGWTLQPISPPQTSRGRSRGRGRGHPSPSFTRRQVREHNHDSTQTLSKEPPLHAVVISPTQLHLDPESAQQPATAETQAGDASKTKAKELSPAKERGSKRRVRKSKLRKSADEVANNPVVDQTNEHRPCAESESQTIPQSADLSKCRSRQSTEEEHVASPESPPRGNHQDNHESDNEQLQHPHEPVSEMRVSTSSDARHVAGFIAHISRSFDPPKVLACGARAVFVALKAVAIASSYLSKDQIELDCIPTLTDRAVMAYTIDLKKSQEPMPESEMIELKIGRNTFPGRAAGALKRFLQEGKSIFLQAVGPDAVLRMVSTVSLANAFFRTEAQEQVGADHEMSQLRFRVEIAKVCMDSDTEGTAIRLSIQQHRVQVQ